MLQKYKCTFSKKRNNSKIQHKISMFIWRSCIMTCFNVYNLQISALKHNFTYSFFVSEDKHNDIKNIEIL